MEDGAETERETRAVVVGDVGAALVADIFAQLVADQKDLGTGTWVRNERLGHFRLARA